MRPGELVTSPWGRYVVTKTSPVVLRALGRENAFVVDPGEAFVATGTLGGVADSPVAVDPRNEKGTGRSPCTSGGGGSPPGSTAQLHELTLGAYRSAMSMAWAPGRTNRVWTPCFTRSAVEGYRLQPHLYFVGDCGSIYCPSCRPSQPRLLYQRDGVTYFDSHHDVVSATYLGFRTAETPGAMVASASSPEATRPALWTSGTDSQSSESDLLAAAAARESTSAHDPPACSDTPVDDAKALPPPGSAPPTCLSREESSSASGDHLSHESPGSPDRATFPPIGRAWMGLWEWQEWCAERAAIIEFDGGITRKIAEEMARALAGPAPRRAA